MINRSDEARVEQLTSAYDPLNPPQLPFDFGDYLSLLWRLDRHASQSHLVEYYLGCARALARAFEFDQRSLGRMVRAIEPGRLYSALGNAPFRATGRLMDASARKSAIDQLTRLRSDVLSIGSYQHDWVVGWPGSGMLDPELRERIFATLFTALRSQYSHFGRLVLVIDIVLQELLLGTRVITEFSLGTLIDRYGYPDPEDPEVRMLYYGESGGR
ncbi:MAG: hypothetical protein JXQ72_04750 [Anaerolineae bacterium]|nr:hypothetical protein [Anaerolineae bacterium]